MSEDVKRLRAACQEALAWFALNKWKLTMQDKHDIAIDYLDATRRCASRSRAMSEDRPLLSTCDVYEISNERCWRRGYHGVQINYTQRILLCGQHMRMYLQGKYDGNGETDE